MAYDKTDIWMPWYPADYLKDTLQMSLDEDCFYRRALDQAWMGKGSIPTDPARLKLLLRVTRAQWDKCSWILIKHFYRDGETYRNFRVDKELKLAQDRADTARKNGRNGGRPRNPEITQPVNPGFPNEPKNVQKNNPEKSSSSSSSSSSSLPPSERENSFARVDGFNLPTRSQEAVALASQARQNPNQITQTVLDRALAVMALYPSKAKKDSRPINKSLQAQNLLAARIAANPGYPWEEHARLIHNNPTPLDAVKWVEDMPNPIALESLRSASASGGISQAAASAPNFYATFDPEKA